MTECIYLINGERTRVKFLRVGAILWLHINGETYRFDAKMQKQKNSQSPMITEKSGELLAPMPGKILKVNVAKGDNVSENQALIVMEAMKMEYTLNAPFVGSIYDLVCREGEQVELGKLLAIVKKSEV